MKKRIFLTLALASAAAVVLCGLFAAPVIQPGRGWIFVLALAAALVLALLLCWRLSVVLTGKFTAPLDQAEQALRTVSEGDVYAVNWNETDDEYIPLFRSIEKLEGYLHGLAQERDKVNLILDCMDEGVVLLDEKGDLITSNRAARKLFHLPEDAENADITTYVHSRRLKKAIGRLQENREAAVIDMQHPRRQGRSLRFFLTPVAGQKYEGKPVGASILISDVTELKRAEGIRSEFTANVSHELKTPLTSIKGFTDMLASGMVTSPEDQKRFLTMIGVEVDRLIDLINDILKVSELESVAIEQCEESSDVLDTANEVANFLAPVAQKANISLKVEGVHLSAAIPFDRLKELLLNLMENGVKYNEPGGSVTVTLEDEPEMVKIIVADTGIGIPEECQSRVFERFYRVQKGRSRTNGGTGLGLAIVKHIVVLYGGRLSLQSELGKGSVFTVELPKKAS